MRCLFTTVAVKHFRFQHLSFLYIFIFLFLIKINKFNIILFKYF